MAVAQGEHIDRFNLATMSGVYPGSRTQVYQRVRIQALQGQAAGWAQIFWYTDPDACVITLPPDDGASVHNVRLTEPQDNFMPRLKQALADAGWQLQSCGTCAFWQSATNANDNLPGGRCGVADNVPDALALQSGLAMVCDQWRDAANTHAAAHDRPVVGLPTPLRKIAETSESKLPFWPRLWRRVRKHIAPPATPSNWEHLLVERSGVGAGTEPCFVCQGRIANLGALAVESDEGDQQTYSVWRCRVCFTTYLQDWIDRWVRLDNLETEERYYRVNPAEARALLQIFFAVAGSEHPALRRERTAQRAQLRAFVAERTPISRQIRQGR